MQNHDDPRASSVSRSLGSRLLAPIAEVHQAEVRGVLLLALTAFVLMTAYYFLKVTREPLILQSGAELKSYASAGQAVLLLGLSRGYRVLVERLPRRRLTVAVYSGFAACIALFAVAAAAQLPIGLPFYLFVGIFSLMVLSQFWSVANDLYTEEQGKRLFAVLGLGTATGAIAGSKLGGVLFGVWPILGPLLAGLLLLLLALALLLRAGGQAGSEQAASVAPAPSTPPSSPKPAALRPGRYIVLLAALILLLNAFNTLGEYILDRVLIESVTAEFGSHQSPEAIAAMGAFKSTYFTYFNAATLLLQTFVASRVLKWFGGRGALFILPVISLACWGATATMPILSVILVAKVAENAVDYSIQSTAWQSMFLVMTPHEKYAAKNMMDTFFVRAGDVTAAAAIYALSHWFQVSTLSFILLNLGLGVVWLLLVWRVYREYPHKAAQHHAERTALEAASPVVA